MNKNLFPLLLSLLILSTSALAQTKTDTKQHRLVFHLATGDTLAHRALMKQLGNVLDYWPTASIEVVIHNRGIAIFRRDQSVLEQDIQAFHKKGVVFAICENTMKQQKLTKAQVFKEAVFVPVGLAEVVLKQEEGWSYIKAGF